MTNCEIKTTEIDYKDLSLVFGVLQSCKQLTRGGKHHILSIDRSNWQVNSAKSMLGLNVLRGTKY